MPGSKHTIAAGKATATEKAAHQWAGYGAQQEVGILAADLVGYSELIFRNAHLGMEILYNSRKIVVDAIDRYRGSILETPGDFVLATFEDSSQVLAAAIEIQEALLKHNQSRDGGGHWKIGLSKGLVYSAGSDHYGHAINIAARLQALAGAGEICFSDALPRPAKIPIGVAIDDLGHKHLKNIDHSVRVYRASLRDYARLLLARPTGTPVTPSKLLQHLRKPVLRTENFKTLGSAKEAALFATGLVGEIQLILSKLTTSIVVVGPDVRIETPPDYVLSGTVQLGGKFLRLMARLTSNSDGHTLWAERFDCDMRRPFEMQDQMAREIVSALQLALTEGEHSTLWKRGTSSGEAWQLFQLGHDQERRYTRHGHRKAKEFYEAALERDPNYLSAIVALAFCHLDEVRLGWSRAGDATIAAAEGCYERAFALVPRHPDVLALRAFLKLFQGQRSEAIAAMEQAIDLAPHSPELNGYRGALYDLMGDYESAARSYRRSLELAPHTAAWIGSNLGLTYLAMDNVFEAETVYREVINHRPEFARAWIGLTVALVRQGKLDEAKRAADSLLSLDPQFTTGEWAHSRPFPDPKKVKAFTDSLKSAGLS